MPANAPSVPNSEAVVTVSRVPPGRQVHGTRDCSACSDTNSALEAGPGRRRCRRWGCATGKPRPGMAEAGIFGRHSPGGSRWLSPVVLCAASKHVHWIQPIDHGHAFVSQRINDLRRVSCPEVHHPAALRQVEPPAARLYRPRPASWTLNRSLRGQSNDALRRTGKRTIDTRPPLTTRRTGNDLGSMRCELRPGKSSA